MPLAFTFAVAVARVPPTWSGKDTVTVGGVELEYPELTLVAVTLESPGAATVIVGGVE